MLTTEDKAFIELERKFKMSLRILCQIEWHNTNIPIDSQMSSEINTLPSTVDEKIRYAFYIVSDIYSTKKAVAKAVISDGKVLDVRIISPMDYFKGYKVLKCNNDEKIIMLRNCFDEHTFVDARVDRTIAEKEKFDKYSINEVDEVDYDIHFEKGDKKGIAGLRTFHDGQRSIFVPYHIRCEYDKLDSICTSSSNEIIIKARNENIWTILIADEKIVEKHLVDSEFQDIQFPIVDGKCVVGMLLVKRNGKWGIFNYISNSLNLYPIFTEITGIEKGYTNGNPINIDGLIDGDRYRFEGGTLISLEEPKNPKKFNKVWYYED